VRTLTALKRATRIPQQPEEGNIMGEYNALQESFRQQQASKEAREMKPFLQNDSAAGDQKLWNEIQDLYGRYNRAEDSSSNKIDGIKTASETMYKLKNMSNGKLFGEDVDNDGVLEITELWMKNHDGTYSHFVPKSRSGGTSEGAGSPLEGAVKNVRDRNRLIKNPNQ
jgi:hypothetical protein